MTKLGIVVPTYNEVLNLPILLQGLGELRLPVDTVIFIVDDDSPDGTSDVARRMSAEHDGLRVITRPGKGGLGSAIRDGMSASLQEGCDAILTMDADLSHDPQDVPRLLAAAQDGAAAVVQGSRYTPGGGAVGVAWWRRVHSRSANILCRWLLGSPRDSTTSFRVYGRRAAELVVAESRARGFEFQPEALLIAMRHGLRVVEVPIVFRSRGSGRSKLGMGDNFRWLLFFAGAALRFRLRIGRFSRSPDSRTGSGP